MLCKPQGPGLAFPKVVERRDDKTNKTQINPLSPQRPMERRQRGFWGGRSFPTWSQAGRGGTGVGATPLAHRGARGPKGKSPCAMKNLLEAGAGRCGTGGVNEMQQ